MLPVAGRLQKLAMTRGAFDWMKAKCFNDLGDFAHFIAHSQRNAAMFSLRGNKPPG
jgi:hypothetical protein